MRTTVTLDDDVYAAAMHLADVSGERLGKVLSKLARRALAPPQRPSPKRRTGRFPTFGGYPTAGIEPEPLGHLRHVYLGSLPSPMARDFDAALKGLPGHQQVTGAYLLSLARRHAATFLTFDAKLRHLTAPGAALEVLGQPA
jgi:hypothetical protein